jgi:hypothetical protein
MIAVPRPKISSAEPHTEHRWRCSLLAGGSYQRALNKSGCIYVERCAKVTYLWLRVFFFQNLGEVCGFANRRILRNGTKPSWATGQRVKYGAPATIFWRHRRSYGLNLANWVFFFSKYGEFIHFCPQETFCKIHRPFFFPSPSGEISPRLWVGSESALSRLQSLWAFQRDASQFQETPSRRPRQSLSVFSDPLNLISFADLTWPEISWLEQQVFLFPKIFVF